MRSIAEPAPQWNAKAGRTQPDHMRGWVCW